MANNLTTANSLLQTEDSEYVRLVSLISGLWDKAEGKIQSVSGQLTWSHYLELL